MQSGRQVLLQAFDRLFSKAATKLSVEFTSEEIADARRGFEERFAPILDTISPTPMEEVPTEVMEEMERSIDELSLPQIAQHLATLPLARQAQSMIQAIEGRRAQQRLLEDALRHADDRYGGN